MATYSSSGGENDVSNSNKIIIPTTLSEAVMMAKQIAGSGSGSGSVYIIRRSNLLQYRKVDDEQRKKIEARSLARMKYNEDRIKHQKQQKQRQQNQHDNTETMQDNDTIHMINIDNYNLLPKFSTEEILCGSSQLGNGAFGVVYEVRGIHIDIETQQLHQQLQHNDDDNTTSAAHRNFIAKHCLRRRRPEDTTSNSRQDSSSKDNVEIATCSRDEKVVTSSSSSSSSRYAIKRLRPQVINDQNKIIQGMVDMATETRILCSLPHHPNIIKLRAIGCSSISHTNNNAGEEEHSSSVPCLSPYSMFHEDNFLVLDRLYGTLEGKWFHWKKTELNLEKKQYKDNQVLNRLLSSFNKQRRSQKITSHQEKNEKNQLLLLLSFEERIKVCHDLASAIGHLHEHNIIHRDVKGKNIGFDIRGDLKLFDFGLARELPTSSSTAGIRTTQTNNDNNNYNNELFHMTGFCGSPRYMSPEIGLHHMYNEKSDVYSYGLLVWEIITLQKPYNDCNMYDLQNIIWPSGGDGGDGTDDDDNNTVISPDDWARGHGRGRTRRGRSNKKKSIICCSRRYNRKNMKSNRKNRTKSLIPHPGLASMIEKTWNRTISSRPSMKELEIYIRNECTIGIGIAADNNQNQSSSSSSPPLLLSSSSVNDIDTACHHHHHHHHRSDMHQRYQRRRSTLVFEKQQQHKQQQKQQQQKNHEK